ncbi:hypothetical protein H6G76_35050 [Nostoc sp. FACHB-152]|uniref:hypothetical protein n=1 Tax=Nostoc sp. FACHB-152 TaxID=2692837 RepID=UPI001686D810|nr:hypothetical protein [Nostoc sp. FACHB-152]MBD2452229.1 hypothetical protein [Nostoc sp. FACHB-152]
MPTNRWGLIYGLVGAVIWGVIRNGFSIVGVGGWFGAGEHLNRAINPVAIAKA